MNDKPILKVEGLSKQYRLGNVGTGTLSHDLNRWWYKIRGKEDPYLKVGAINTRNAAATQDYVWALNDINFQVNKGEVLGIIGKNGAGKSTLLKILSRVTSPTTGSIKTRGRIASLLEVGTGFHPELTGKENIYLNGAILGMNKAEISSKIDEIIEFSGCQMYIDTPVKRYSSGMHVRLAFAVAAFMEPDILVIDEVLAVGDAEFQKKAVGKMQDIAQGEGRTVLFVSHNMAAVRNLCTRGMVLVDGETAFEGDQNEAVDFYLNLAIDKNTSNIVNFKSNGKEVYLKSVAINSSRGQSDSGIFMGEHFTIITNITSNKSLNNIKCSVLIQNYKGEKIAALRTFEMTDITYKAKGSFELSVNINDLNLMPGTYSITIALAENNETLDVQRECLNFQVLAKDVFNTGKIPRGNFIMFSKATWDLKEL